MKIAKDSIDVISETLHTQYTSSNLSEEVVYFRVSLLPIFPLSGVIANALQKINVLLSISRECV